MQATEEMERYKLSAHGPTGVCWDDIIGQDEAKLQLQEAIEQPHQRPELFELYKMKPISGILLYGPPGCGKTMLGRAAATSLARIFTSTPNAIQGQSPIDDVSSLTSHMAEGNLLYVKSPELIDYGVGLTEANIRRTFAWASNHKKVHGCPGVIFFDEADAVLGERKSWVGSTMARTMLPTFLTEMDGLEESGAIVILATNRPESLDPAVVRDGRVDRKIKLARPSSKEVCELFARCLDSLPLKKDYSLSNLAEYCTAELFSPLRVLRASNSARFAPLTLAHVVSYAMIVNIVEQAKSRALQRDFKSRLPEGMGKKDLLAAIDSVLDQNKAIAHDVTMEDLELAETLPCQLNRAAVN